MHGALFASLIPGPVHTRHESSITYHNAAKGRLDYHRK